MTRLGFFYWDLASVNISITRVLVDNFTKSIAVWKTRDGLVSLGSAA